MYKLACTVAAAVIVFPTWKYFSLKSENMEHEHPPSQMEEWENFLTVKQNEDENLTEELKPQRIKNARKLQLNSSFGHVFTAVSGSMPLDRLSFLLLINICGADLVASIPSVFQHLSSTNVLFDVALSFALAVVTLYKWKNEKAELERRNTDLQQDSVRSHQGREDVVATLTELKAELEKQRTGLRALLEELEGEREVNKQKLQEVEREITEVTFDRREELLGDKEHLLKAQWKLDERKKNSEKQMLNVEKLLEPLDVQLTKTHRQKE